MCSEQIQTKVSRKSISDTAFGRIIQHFEYIKEDLLAAELSHNEDLEFVKSSSYFQKKQSLSIGREKRKNSKKSDDRKAAYKVNKLFGKKSDKYPNKHLREYLYDD